QGVCFPPTRTVDGVGDGRSVLEVVPMIRRFALVTMLTWAGWAGAQAGYFVQADMVRGAANAMGAVCGPNSVFFPGEQIVFRAVVYDAATGQEMRHADIAARGIEATGHIDDRSEERRGGTAGGTAWVRDD